MPKQKTNKKENCPYDEWAHRVYGFCDCNKLTPNKRDMIKIKRIDYKHHSVVYSMFSGEKRCNVTPKESKNVESVIITHRGRINYRTET